MTSKKIATISTFVALIMVFAFYNPAAAKFPAKDITLICPWSAGGGTDTVSRALVKNAKKYFGVNVNVVNKTGGMGAIGMGAAANARPDGYTVGMITFQLSTYRSMGLAKLSYRDFNLIQLVNQSPAAISVAADSKWKSLKQLMDYAKKNPGIVTVGHSGAGGGGHELQRAITGRQYFGGGFSRKRQAGAEQYCADEVPAQCVCTADQREETLSP